MHLPVHHVPLKHKTQMYMKVIVVYYIYMYIIIITYII